MDCPIKCNGCEVSELAGSPVVCKECADTDRHLPLCELDCKEEGEYEDIETDSCKSCIGTCVSCSGPWQDDCTSCLQGWTLMT